MSDALKKPRVTNDSPISRMRLSRGLTQKQLAEKSGCAPKEISRLENGMNQRVIESVIKIADAMECTLDELLR